MSMMTTRTPMKQPDFYPFGKARPASDKHLKQRWSGGKPGVRFRCYLCGHKFVKGDLWKAIFANHLPNTRGNFLVCDTCDDGNALTRYQEMCQTLSDIWWARQ
jgi:hypothetical protein